MDTSLHKSSYTGSLRTVRLLLDSGADPNLGDAIGDRALHKAAFSGHVEVCRRLVLAGAEVDARTDDHETPLHKAAWAGQRTTVEALIGLGANVDALDNIEDTPLAKAAFGGFRTCLQELLARGANPNLRSVRLDTPLHKAAFAGNEACVDILLSCGADPTLHDIEMDLPLHKSAFAGSVACVRLLLADRSGPETLEARNDRGQSAIMLAALSPDGFGAAVELLAAGADPSAVDAQGDNTLHHAAQSGCRATIEALLASHVVTPAEAMAAMESGKGSNPRGLVDVSARNGLGMTAFETAFHHRNRGAILALTGFLREHMPAELPDLQPRQIFDLELSGLPVAGERFEFEVSRRDPLGSALGFLRLPAERMRADVAVRFVHSLDRHQLHHGNGGGGGGGGGAGVVSNPLLAQQQPGERDFLDDNDGGDDDGGDGGDDDGDVLRTPAGSHLHRRRRGGGAGWQSGGGSPLSPNGSMTDIVVETAMREGVQSGFFKEFVTLLSRQMFHLASGCFQEFPDGGGRIQPSAWAQRATPPGGLEVREFFHLAGKLVGTVLFHGHILPVALTRPLVRLIRGDQVTPDDLADLDPALAEQLVTALRTPGIFEDALAGTTFSVDETFRGVTVTVPLVPGGEGRPVTEANKAEYIRLYAMHRVCGAARPEIDVFLSGVWEIVPPGCLRTFPVDLLDATISGEANISVDDWRANTDLEGCGPSTPQVRWFFEIVAAMDPAERRSLLMFCTALARLPVDGFGSLQTRFKIVLLRRSEDAALPVSYTCINAIHLPMYTSKQRLETRLRDALRQPLMF
jgi:ankyrin repeat protein